MLTSVGNQQIHSDLVEIYNVSFAYVDRCVYQELFNLMKYYLWK